MSFFKVDLKGLETLEVILNNIATEKVDQIEAEFEATAYDIADNAKARVPKDMGQLANSITVRNGGRLRWEIPVQKRYAAFVEFGTGQHAAEYLGSQDAELRAYAQTFYVNGLGRMMPTPFLFPAMMQEKAKLVERIKTILLS